MSRRNARNKAMNSTPLASPHGDVGTGSTSSASRRNFIKGSGMMLAGGAIVGANLAVARGAHAYGSETIRIGLVGCGGRGTGAAIQALGTSGGGVKLTAMADVFENNLQTAYRTIKGKFPESISVEATRFVGLTAYEDVLASDIDLVILATPPGFRPLQFETAIAAGKHVFMEKPVATDVAGVKRVLAANEIAIKKGLAVQVGLQRHHELRYQECIARLQDGIIGDPVFARAYWNGAGVWMRPRSQDQSELEYQLRNWYYFNWLSGDHINEQHIHNLDVINWLMQSYPVEAQGQGGREVRTGENTGQIFDHHMVEYTYDSGAKMLSQCRHIPGCWNSVSEHVHCTNGYADISGAKIFDPKGNLLWQSDAKEVNGKGWQQEQVDLFAALRHGEVPNEADYGAKSTMTAILGRMATYSGKVVKWDEAMKSDVSLANVDALRSLNDLAPLLPDASGNYLIPVPGKTKVLPRG